MSSRSARSLMLVISALALVIACMSTAVAVGLAQSASKVDVIAVYVDSATNPNEQHIRVELDIADGWHVNANPASLDFLVPTSIDATAGSETLPLNIAWPEGQDSGIELGGTHILVYSDGTTVPIQPDPVATGNDVTLNVRVQACSNKGLCLPPSTLHVQPLGS